MSTVAGLCVNASVTTDAPVLRRRTRTRWALSAAMASGVWPVDEPCGCHPVCRWQAHNMPCQGNKPEPARGVRNRGLAASGFRQLIVSADPGLESSWPRPSLPLSRFPACFPICPLHETRATKPNCLLIHLFICQTYFPLHLFFNTPLATTTTNNKQH